MYLTSNTTTRPDRKVVVANFGPNNSLWPECRDRGTIVTYEDEDLRRLFMMGDEVGYQQVCMSSKLSASGGRVGKGTATTWWNINKKFEASQDEIWLHRDDRHLWWTISKAGPIVDEPRRGSGLSRNSDLVHVLHKPAQPWSCKSVNGRPLQWTGLHPKARPFLQKGQGTLGYMPELHAQYAQALIHDESLDVWHDLPEWRQKAEQAGFRPVIYVNVEAYTAQQKMEQAAARMVDTAIDTVRVSNGQVEERTVKQKDCAFVGKEEFKAYVLQLLKDQGGRCKLTGLKLKWDSDEGDGEMQPSLDRIDSDGHYAPGNLQVVCKFANLWKGSQDNATFLRLIEKVRSVTP